MKKLPHILSLLLYTIAVHAQSLHIDSTRFIGGGNTAYVLNTADKGILFTGFATPNPGGIIPNFPYGYNNALIGKIDSNQQISWIKVYGGSQDDAAGPSCQTPDGGYAVLGGTESNDGDVTGFKGENDIWLLRIDGNGNLLWEKTYGSSLQDGGISIANTPDHGFIILGSTNGSDGDVPFHYGSWMLTDWVVIKTDSMGNVQWSRDLGGTEDEGEGGAILPVDGGYYLVSGSASIDHDCTDTAWHPAIAGTGTGNNYFVLRLDSLGNVLWDSSYGGSHSDAIATAMFDTRDSTIVMMGTTYSPDYMVTGTHVCGGNDEPDMWMVKVNKNGTLLWEKTLGSVQEETGTGLCIAPNGGYMALGWTFIDASPACVDSTIGNIGAQDCWLFYLDSAGNQVANKIFGGTSIDLSNSIIPYLNGYIATGTSGSSVFTEGTTYGNFESVGVGFLSYINYWPLAVNNITKNVQQLFIYPNPTHSNINIKLPANDGAIFIFNGIGQIIYSEEIEQQVYRDINTEAWADGLYLIQWRSVDGSVLSAKLIKN